MIVSLVLLGTWPALLCLLERRGRLPSHTFLDYAVTNYLVAIVVALTLGQIGSSTEKTPNFTTQLKQVCTGTSRTARCFQCRSLSS